MRQRVRLWSFFIGACASLGAHAASPERARVPFARTWNVGPTRSVCVVGSHPDIGNWDPAAATRLTWTPGNVWTGQIAIQRGTALEYKLVARTNAPGAACNPDNVEWMLGSNLTVLVPPAQPPPFAGKTLHYHSGWTNASLIYRIATNWFDMPMVRVGAGRAPGEYRYRVDTPIEPGGEFEFIPHGWFGGNEFFDHAPYGGYGNSNYFTALDVCFLQDGNVFNYEPPATVSASRIVTTNVNSSWAPTIPGRNVRIYLPRGYDNNPWKRYPVLYLHDGQNVFPPSVGFGTWDADSTATREISQGRLRESIMVAIDNNDNRLAEYCPTGDTIDYQGQLNLGIGHLYAAFIIHNVRPTLDTHFRTLTDPRNTLVMGSSMGGLISSYMGWETNGFGGIGIMSPSYWAASNFVARINTGAKRPLRHYMDFGTAEGDLGAWNDTWAVYSYFLADGYAPNDDLMMVTGCGQGHNEPAWAARLPNALRFLLDVRDEPNAIALETHPPAVDGLSSTSTIYGISVTALQRHAYTLERASAVGATQWQARTATTGILPWATITLQDPAVPATNPAFYRVRAE